MGPVSYRDETCLFSFLCCCELKTSGSCIKTVYLTSHISHLTSHINSNRILIPVNCGPLLPGLSLPYKIHTMKKYLFLNIIFCLLLAACKKEQIIKTSAYVAATPAQLATLGDSIKGSWGYVFGIEYFYNTGLPSLNDFPFNASVIINDTSPLTTVDYDGNTANIPYTLSGVNGTFYLNIQKSAADSRKLKIVKLTADLLITQNTITGIDTSSKAIFI